MTTTNAEVPERTSESAPSNLPAEAASSSSAPTPSVDPALPESAIGVPDQVMSEGWSSSSDAAQESPTAPDHSIHPIWTIETGQGMLCATQKQ